MPLLGCAFAGTPVAATVQVNIAHPRRGDLVVDLIEPDGTTHRLRDADPGDIGADIHETYGVELTGSGMTAAAQKQQWQLRVQDVASGSTGAIDAWTLSL
jgi:serine protease